MKDRFHLDDIIYYGRSYPDLPPYLWWYCKNDGQIYDTDTLKTEFHFSDEGEMEEPRISFRFSEPISFP